MTKEDSLQFVQERLRQNHSSLHRELHLQAPPRVTRRVALDIGHGEHRKFDRVDTSVVVCCARGSVWITQDGDPKDIILEAGESYRAQREDALHVFALQPGVIEIEFEDAVMH